MSQQPPQIMADLVGEALNQPINVIAYSVSRHLAAMFPDKAILETNDRTFDIESFASAGQCLLVQPPVMHNHNTVAWDDSEKILEWNAQNVWFEVTWGDHALDVLMMNWIADGAIQYCWLLADSQQLAEEFFSTVCAWNAEVREEVLVFDNGYWSKSDELFQAIKSATFDNLVLHGTLKQDILDDVRQFFGARELYTTYGVPWKRGLLFVGPPGNGKTHAIKALINTLGRPCLYVKSFKSRHGPDTQSIQQVFYRARASAPCILVLEDLDSLITPSSRSFFLNELDGFAANAGVLTLATTNHPDRLDPAIVNRPSRFDRKYHFNLPSDVERLAYIQLWNGTLQPALQLDEPTAVQIAALTDGFSFAYLKELFIASVMGWVARPQPGTMGAVVLAQVAALREQMHSAIMLTTSENENQDEDED